MCEMSESYGMWITSQESCYFFKKSKRGPWPQKALLHTWHCAGCWPRQQGQRWVFRSCRQAVLKFGCKGDSPGKLLFKSTLWTYNLYTINASLPFKNIAQWVWQTHTLGNHHHNQDKEHLYHPKKVPSRSSAVSLPATPSSRKVLTCFLSGEFCLVKNFIKM